MGLFNKNKKAKEEQVVAANIPDIEYADLRSSLKEALSSGSKDSKFLDIKTKDNKQFYIFTNSGNIKYAYSDSFPLGLSERLFWVKNDNLETEKLNKIVSIAKDLSTLDFYANILKEVPESKPVIDEILKDYTLSVIQDLNKLELSKIFTELMFDKKSTLIENVNFINVSVDSAIDTVEKLDNDEKKLLKSLNTGSNEETKLKLNEDTPFNPKNDRENLLYFAAEAQTTVLDVKQASTGFLFADVLQTLNSLIYKKQILVDEVETESVDDALPELVFDQHEEHNEKVDVIQDVVSTPTATTESSIEKMISEGSPAEMTTAVDNTEDSPNDTETTVIVDEINEEAETPDSKIDDLKEPPMHAHSHTVVYEDDDEWEYSYPPEDSLDENSEDDGGFDFEIIDENINEGFTGGLDDSDFEKDINKILSHSSVEQSDRKAAEKLVKENKKLEKEVIKIESDLKDYQSEYNETIVDYQNISLEKGISGILEEESASEDKELESTKDTSNDVFFNIHSFESNRYDINMKRKSVLQELFNIVDRSSSDYTQEMIHRISLKLEGIDNVMNTAFHDPKDDEGIPVDEELVKAFNKDSAPIFFKLVEEFGFDPFDDISNNSSIA